MIAVKVKEIMTKDVVSVNPETSIAEAAKTMNSYGIGSVPVCQNQSLVGILTDRDIVLRNIAQGMDPVSTKVRDVMTKEVFTTNPNADIEDASDVMISQQVRRLPVVEHEKLVGIIALGDIALEDEYEFEAAEALSEISEAPKNN
jgi:CBS domain-containing protein